MTNATRALTIALSIFIVYPLNAQTTRQVTDKLVFPTGSTFDDEFGRLISIEGDRAMIGTSEETLVYERIGGEWQRLATIQSVAEHSLDLSGTSVLIDLELWIETSPGTFTIEAVFNCDGAFDRRSRLDGDMVSLNCGDTVAKSYRRSAGVWTGLDDIPIDDRAIEVADPRVFVAHATSDPFGIDDAGSVDVFFFESDGSWTYEAELTASNAGIDYRFGDDLRSDGLSLAVRASNPIEYGGVYVFQRTGTSWSQDPRIHRLNEGVLMPRLDGDRLSLLAAQNGRPTSCASSPCEIIVYSRQGDGSWSETSSSLLYTRVVWDQDLGDSETLVSFREPDDTGAGHIRSIDTTTGQTVQLINPDPTTSPTFHDIREISASGHRLFIRSQGADEFGYRIFSSAEGSWVQEAEIAEPFDVYGNDFTVRMTAWGPRFAISTYDHGDGLTHVFKESGGAWNEESLSISRYLSDLSLFAESFAFSGERFNGQHTESKFFNGTTWADHTPVNTVATASMSQSGSLLASFGLDINEPALTVIALDELRPSGARDSGQWKQLLRTPVALPFVQPQWYYSGSTDFSSDRFILGIDAADHPWPDSGSALIFRADPNDWVLEADLTLPSVDAEDFFGRSTALVGDTAFVGAPGNDLIAPNAGAVFVYRRNGTTWDLIEILVAADAQPADAFGNSIAAWGTTIAITAPYADGIGNDTGAVYILDDPALFPTQINARLGGDGDELFFDLFGHDDGSVVAGAIGSWGLGGSEGYLASYDHYGVKTAGRRFGGTADDRFEGLARATDGSIYAAGSQSSWGSGGSATWLVKTDASFANLWQRSGGGPADEGYATVAATADGGAIAVGWAESWGPGMRSAVIHRFDAAGTKLWGSTRGGASNDELRDVLSTSSGTIVAVGRQSSWGPGGSNGWLMVFDPDGTRTVGKSWGGDFDDGLEAITELEGGGFVAVGWRGMADGTTQGWYLRLDAGFNLLSTATHGTDANDDRFDDVFEVAGQAVYAVGSSDRTDLSTEAWFTVLSLRDGSIMIERKAGGTVDKSFQAIARSGFDGLLVAGDQGALDAGSQDAWIRTADWDGSW